MEHLKTEPISGGLEVGVGGFIRGLLPLVFDLYDMASSFCVVLMLYKTLMNSYETLMISSLNSV